jgi:hypothetical protein
MTPLLFEDAVAQVREDMNRLRGRLFGTVEASGLSDRQVEAIKRIIRQETHEAQANVEATLRGGRVG